MTQETVGSVSHGVVLPLPNIVRVSDYHEFPGIAEMLSSLTGHKIHVAELGMDGSRYVGVVYRLRRPTKASIADLLEKHSITLKRD